MLNENADIKETHDLIASDKVEGTKVYGIDGNSIGKIERIILEKRGNRIAYAVMSFGGFLGMGHDHYPLPWEKLDYNEELGGYQVDLTEDQVKGAPTFADPDAAIYDQEEGRRIYDYYGVPPYWGAARAL